MIGYDLGDRNLVVRAQSPRHIHGDRRHIQVKRCAQFRKPRPLGQRFEMVDRLPRLHFDNALKLAASIGGHQHDIRIHGRRTAPDDCVLFLTGIDSNLKSSSKTGLQQADDAIVFELLADGPHQNRTHTASRAT